MFLEQPHEIHAPQAEPIARRSRVSPILTWLLVLVAVGGVGAAGWWYLKVYQPNHPKAVNTSNTNVVARKTTTSNTNTAKSFVDSDADGLSDEVEALYGTDAHKADSDDDGYSDSDEVKNGYEPLIAEKGKRMVDLSLVAVVGKSVPNPVVVSSGVSGTDHQRYYLVYDGSSTSYFGADGSLVVQCTNDDEAGKCATLPNEVRTDFSRTFTDGKTTDAFHSPF